MAPRNVHATVIAVDNTGLLFVGPSGIGKSALAFSCLAAARRSGWAASLVADDQVFISRRGEELIAARPASIAGLLEIRGSGIARVPSIPEAVLRLAVLIVDPRTADRQPPADEIYDLDGIGTLPQIRLSNDHRDPLAAIAALRPDLGIPTTL
jgi:serine kinase of HPr protein (carbohydrate metabolism regulator)